MLNNPFFTGFLKVSNFYTIAAVILLVAALYVQKVLKDKRTSFSTRMLVALVLGLGLGILLDVVGTNMGGAIYTDTAKGEITAWFALLGSGFLRLVQLLAVPVVFLSIIEVMSNVKGDAIKKLTGKSFGILLGTTAISAVVAIIVVKVFNLDAASFAKDLSESMATRTETVASQSFPQFFLQLIPNNMFSVMTDNGAIVSVVIVGGLFASALRFLKGKKPEQIRAFDEFLTSAKVAVTSVLTNVIKFMPYGVVALVANTIVSNGMEAIMGMIGFIGALYLSTAIMLLVYVVILIAIGVNPVTFYKKALPTMLFAFSSRSSVGTLPYTLTALNEDMGVSKQTSNFVATLGTTIGMNGCAGVFPAMLGVLVAAATPGVTMDAAFYVMLVTVVTVGSIGIAGVPGTATVAATVTLNGIGLGSAMSSIGAVFGIDPIVDMGRTMLNVTGSMVSSVFVDKTSGTMDMDVFNAPVVARDDNE